MTTRPCAPRLARALEARGFEVIPCASVAEATAKVREKAPAFAVCDLRLEDGNGLEVVQAIQEARPGRRVVMLTGYGNIATAVAAVKSRRGRLPGPSPPTPTTWPAPSSPPAKACRRLRRKTR